jgi:rod shape-determining protein MreC
MLPPRHHRAANKAFWKYWPRRFISERGVLVILLIVSLMLMLTSQFSPGFSQRVRAGVFDQLSGILNVLATPAKSATTLFEHITGLSDMSADLANLREENARLKEWYDRARQLEAENRSLRNLVHLADLPQAKAVTARVIAESSGSFAQSVIVDAGEDEQVSANSVAMTGNGVVGRALTISDSSSNILLLTDVNSRIPVVIENSRHRGILAGDNSLQPILMYLPDDASVTVGERVLTSGDAAGVFAPGLPVGVVVSVQPHAIRIQPFADLKRLDFIQLIDFGRSSILQQATQKPAAPVARPTVPTPQAVQ